MTFAETTNDTYYPYPHNIMNMEYDWVIYDTIVQISILQGNNLSHTIYIKPRVWEIVLYIGTTNQQKQVWMSPGVDHALATSCLHFKKVKFSCLLTHLTHLSDT